MAGEITEQETNFDLVADTTLSPTSDGPGLLIEWISWLANRLKSISGKEYWYEDPDITLAEINEHILSDRPHPDSVPITRKIVAGSGLSGGGDLSTDRVLEIAKNKVTDSHIGDRTINDSLSPPSNSGTVTELLSGMANMIKTITGEDDWKTSPVTSLRELDVGVDTLVFPQLMPSSKWVIQHNLSRYPSVSIVDSAGSLVLGDVTYISDNELCVEFKAPFSGTCYLN